MQGPRALVAMNVSKPCMAAIDKGASGRYFATLHDMLGDQLMRSEGFHFKESALLHVDEMRKYVNIVDVHDKTLGLAS